MQQSQVKTRPWAVLIKGLLFFLILNFLYALPWSDNLEKITIYNTLIPGNKRFNGITDIDLNMATHLISASKKPDEFRVAFIGDSSTFGYLLDEDETVTELINNANLETCDGKQVRVYNLANTGQSTLMDLMMIESVQSKKPDMIVWLFTLNAFMDEKITMPSIHLPVSLQHYDRIKMSRQFVPKFVMNNPEKIAQVISKYGLNLEIPPELKADQNNLWNRSLFSQRNHIADWYNMQIEGIRSESVGDDGTITIGWKRDFIPASQKALPSTKDYRRLTAPISDKELMYTEAFEAAIKSVADIPTLLVNEPILISVQENSDIHYNDTYPRWAYNQYRRYIRKMAIKENWSYLDLWNIVPRQYFTNSVFHRSPEGEQLVAEKVAPAILDLACKK